MIPTEIRLSSAGLVVGVEPRLAEEAVLLAIRSAPARDRADFRRERDAIYTLRDPEERDGMFHALHARWFTRLGLAAPLIALLDEHPGMAAGVSRCLVLTARGDREQHADLHDDRSAPGGRVLILRVIPESIVRTESLAAIVRRELMHVADMIDPDFRYSRHGPDAAASAARRDRIRARYAILWDTTIDGRLSRAGMMDDRTVPARIRQIAESFGIREDEAAALHRRFFDPPRPDHGTMLAAASVPEADRGALCALCRLPSADLGGPGSVPDPDVAARIRSDFPAWDPGAPVCRQCQDLYAARVVRPATAGTPAARDDTAP